jgi:hypothetical protein
LIVALSALQLAIAAAFAQSGSWVPYGSPQTSASQHADAILDSFSSGAGGLTMYAEGWASGSVGPTNKTTSDDELFDISVDATWDWSGPPGTSPALTVMGDTACYGYSVVEAIGANTNGPISYSDRADLVITVTVTGQIEAMDEASVIRGRPTISGSSLRMAVLVSGA